MRGSTKNTTHNVYALLLEAMKSNKNAKREMLALGRASRQTISKILNHPHADISKHQWWLLEFFKANRTGVEKLEDLYTVAEAPRKKSKLVH